MTNRRAFLQGAGAAAATLPFIREARASPDTREAWERAADIARNVSAPTFPDRVFDITNFGAVPMATR